MSLLQKIISTICTHRFPKALPLAALTACIALGIPHHAAALTWDINPGDGSTITSGTGNWDLTTPNWNDGSNSTVWANNSTAVFAGTAPALGDFFDITLLDSFTASTLTFNTDGYRLNAPTAQTISLTNYSNAIRVNPGVTALIGSNITIDTTSATATTQIRGGGTLQIAGTLKFESVSNNFDMGGGTTIEVLEGGQWLSSNSIVVGGQYSTGQTASVILNGGTIVTGHPGSSSIEGTSRNFLLGHVANTNSTVTINSGDLIVSEVASTGLRVAQGDNSIGLLNLNGGTVTTPNLFGGAGTDIQSTVNFNGSTIIANRNNGNFMHNLTNAWINTGGAIFDTNGFNITISQVLSHHTALGATADGGLTKLGLGTLSLTGSPNTYTGSTIIKEGKLSITSDGHLGTVPSSFTPDNIIIDGGTLLANGNITINANRGITIGSASGSGSGTIEVVNARTLTYAGIIANNGTDADRLIKTGLGTLALNGNNTFSGGVTINEGRLTFNTAANLGIYSNVPSSYIRIDGGILQFNGTAHLPLTSGLTIGSNGATYEQASNFNFRFNGAMTGNGDITFTKIGTATGYIGISNNSNNYTGKSTLTDATLVEIRSNNALGAAGNANNGTIIEAGSTLRIDPNNSGGAGTNLNINEWFTLDNGTIHNSTRDNTLNGQLTLIAGGFLTSNSGTSITQTGKITGGGYLAKSGAGTVTFTNDSNDYTGKTIVTAGTLVVNANSSLGDTHWVDVRSGANLNFLATGYRLGGSINPRAFSGSGTVNGNVSFGDNYTLRPGTTSIAADITTAGDGIGSLTFANDLTLEGGASILNPRLSLTLKNSDNITDTSTPANILAFDNIAPVSETFHDYLSIGGDFLLDSEAFVEIVLSSDHTLTSGQVFNLIDWGGDISLNANGDSNSFSLSHLILPDITSLGLDWGTEHFTTHGILYTTLAVPEPSRPLLLLTAFTLLLTTRRRRF